MPRKKRRKTGQRPQADAEAQTAGLTPEQQAEAEARREQQKLEWQQRKKAKERKKTPTAVYAWAGGIVATVAVVAVAVFLLLQGGGDDSSASSGITPTPDRRVAGLPVDQTIEVEAGDAGQATGTFFEPGELAGQAGQVIEIKVTNIGSVAHNLRVSGTDSEYDTRDDFLSEPGTIDPGEEGIVTLKIDEPGAYPFRCDFHSQQQIGTLILN
jgi:plastocyanin